MPEPTSCTPTMKRIVLFIAVISSFLTPFDSSSVNIALPSMGAEFGLDAISLSWITTAYLLSIAVFLVPFGKLADIYGRKKVFLLGISLFSLSSLLLSFSFSASMLISLRLVQGLGSAMLFGTSLAIVSSVFPPGERGKALGITIAAVYLGLSMGPFLGGYMTAYLGWRSIFLVNVPLGALCILFTGWKLPLEWKTAAGERFDLRGSLLWGSALIVLIYGLSLIPERAGVILAVAGVAGIILFAALELGVPDPVLDIRLFSHNRVFAFSNLAALINYSATYAVTFLLSLYLQISKDFSPETAGLILVAQPVTMALFAPLSGRLSDRVDPSRVASLGMAFTAGGLFLLTMIGPASSLPFLIGSLIVLGIGFGIFSSPNTNAILSSVDRSMYGVASGMVGTMRLLGQIFSMAVAMTLFSFFIGREEITDANLPLFLQSMHAAFYLFFFLCVAGVFFSLVRGRTTPWKENCP